MVCDAGAFGQQGGGANAKIEKDIRNLDELRVCDWLRPVSYRVPDSDAFQVATKCDLASRNTAGTRSAENRCSLSGVTGKPDPRWHEAC